MNSLEGTVPGEMAKAFKAKVEELSGGSIIIDIQANGVLGSEDQLIDNLLGGGNLTDFTRITASALTQYGCGKAALLGIPYTFVSDEHFYKFAESDLAQEILLEPREIGLPIRGLCYAQEGFRHFFFKNPVSDISDLKNMKRQELQELLEKFYDGTVPTTVLREDKPTHSKLHPTMKPIRLISKQIRNSSKKGELVLDIFGGSGSTLIAAEQLGRKCNIVELDPKFCDVIIDRFERFTGKKAEKVNG
jgi:hypothetical protein